jgi:hypothetical protein
VTPGKINFLCPQGATFQKTVTIKIDETPLNLTGYSSRLQVRENYYSASTIVNLLSSGSGLTISGSAGVIDILIADEVTKNFTAGTFVYDLEIESLNGTVDRVLEGNFIITPEVTR